MDQEEKSAVGGLSLSRNQKLPFTLVLIHGAGHSAGLWDALIAGLAERAAALAVDLPGHGGRTAEPGRESIAAYAEWLMDWIRRNTLGRVVLCGHSMGGAIVQHLLVHHPDLFAAGVLVNSGARLRVKNEFLDGILRNHARFLDQLFGYGFAEHHQTPTMREAFVRSCNGAPHTALRDFNACNDFDMMQQIGVIGVPILVIAADLDRMTPLKYGTFLVEKIAGARLCVIPSAGHYAPMEQPATVTAAIIDFLESLA
jgi:pimeloyl-ACP methyl ester carboxylesterase